MMRRSLPLLFDAVTWVAFVLVHGVALVAGLAVADAFGATLLGRVAGILVGFFVYLHVFVLVLGITKRIVQPTLHEGRTPVGANRAYIAWGLNSVLQGIYLTSPFLPLIQLLFTLRFLHLRTFGMQLRFNNIVGFGSELRQVELIEVGEGTTIGARAGLTCHLTVDGHTHRQAKIRIGRRSLIGVFARVGPGVTVGDDVVVGAGSGISEDVVIEDGVRIGAMCFVRRGVRIGAGARIDSGAVVTFDVPAGARVRAAAAFIEEAQS